MSKMGAFDAYVQDKQEENEGRMEIGEALQILKDKGYTIKEILDALAELGRRNRSTREGGR